MYVTFWFTVGIFTTSILASPILDASTSDDKTDAYNLLADLQTYAHDQAQNLLSDSWFSKRSGCSKRNIKVRKEWGSLSGEERVNYTNAVLCLQKSAAKSPASFAAGAKTRYDDWVASHINQTLTIHYTGTFLAWHRYFVWHYEQALQNECGYTGTQPYWDWSITAKTGTEASPIWDGSATSVSGNGAPIANQGDIVLGGIPGVAPIILPAGSGGGCVTSGPFKDMKVNLGPAALPIPGNKTIAEKDPTAYNPRCLKRDLTDYVNQRYANASSIIDLVYQHQEIDDFQMTMQGKPGTGELGVHGGGHYTIGGDPGRDAFISPGDPVFFLHHAMIDRTWWQWQMLDPKNRIKGSNAIAGTETFLNLPPSPNVTFDTVIDLNYIGGPDLPMRDLMSTFDGPFCYVYA